MKMHTDCLPCIARGSLDAARLATDDRIFFLFKAKCTVVARHAECNLNDMVIKTYG